MPGDGAMTDVALRDPVREKEWPCGCTQRTWMRDNGPLNQRIPEVHLFVCEVGDKCVRNKQPGRHVSTVETIRRLRIKRELGL